MGTYNFGRVIDSYIATVFPPRHPVVPAAVASATDQRQSQDEAAKVPRRQLVLQCLQAVVIIAGLVALCMYSLHSRSSYYSKISLRSALKDPIAPNESGFSKLLEGLASLNSGVAKGQDGDAAAIRRVLDIDLGAGTGILRYSEIRSRRDVALWLQFGLIPSLITGLNSYNKLVGDIIRLTFLRTDYSDIEYGAAGNQAPPAEPPVSPQTSGVLRMGMAGYEDDDDTSDDSEGTGSAGDTDAVEDEEEEDVVKMDPPPNVPPSDPPDAGVQIPEKGDGGEPDSIEENEQSTPKFVLKLPYASEGTYHTYSKSGGNFLYIPGSNLYAAMTALNMGYQYGTKSPHFPLWAIISDPTTTSVTLEAFTSNAHDYTVSYANVSFTFLTLPDGSANLSKVAKASSISSPRDGLTHSIQQGIFGLVVILAVIYVVHSVAIHRRYQVYTSKVLFGIDVLSKVSLVACIIAYAVRLYWFSGSAPYIRSVMGAGGDYENVVTQGRDGLVIDATVLRAGFNTLRTHVLGGYMSMGVLQVASFCTICLLIVLCFAMLCSGGRVGTMMCLFVIHSTCHLGLGIVCVLSALALMALVNMCILDHTAAGDGSFVHHFITLAYILAGANGSRVDAYYRNHGALHMVSIIVLLAVFSYCGMISILPIMLTLDADSEIRSFESKKPNGPYDESRYFRTKYALGRLFRRFSTRSSAMFLRHLAFSRNGNSAGPGTAGQPSSTGLNGMQPRSDQAGGNGMNHPNIAATSSEGATGGYVDANSTQIQISQNDAPDHHATTVPHDVEGQPVAADTPQRIASRRQRFRIWLYKFRSDHRNFRMLFYWIVVVAVMAFAIRDRQYRSVRRLLQQTLNDHLTTDVAQLPCAIHTFVLQPPADAEPPDEKLTKGPKDPSVDVPEDLRHSSFFGVEDMSSAGNSSIANGEDTDNSHLAPPGMNRDPPIHALQLSGLVPSQDDGGLNDGQDAAAVQRNKDNSSASQASDTPDSKGAQLPSKQNAGEPDGVKKALVRVSQLPRRISTRKDVFQWLTAGGLGSLFKFLAFNNDMLNTLGEVKEFLTIKNRFFAVPSQGAILVELKLRAAAGFKCPMFSTMEHDAGSATVRSLLHSTSTSIGARELFGNYWTDFPDVVERVQLELFLVDSYAQSKLYRATIWFDMRTSGTVVPKVKVRSILGVHLSSSYNNWVFASVSISSLVLFIAFAWWFVIDCRKFFRGYDKRYGVTNGNLLFWRKLFVFFVNDRLRFVDLFVIILIGVICGLYVSIHFNSNVIYENIQGLSTTKVRLIVNAAMHDVRIAHRSLWVLLGIIVFLVLVAQVQIIRNLFVVLFVCLECALILYITVAAAMLLLLLTFIYVIMTFANDYFHDLSKDEGIILGSIRLLLGKSQLPSHVLESSYFVMVMYPGCLVMKLWIINMIFVYLWAIWPKDELDEDAKDLAHTEEMFRCDSVEGYQVSANSTNLTTVADDQLEMIPDDVKQFCAEEVRRFNAMFKEFDEKLVAAGARKFEYVQELHDRLGHEMHEMLKSCEALQMQLEVARKRCEIMESHDDRNLEANISLLEIALSDKQDELASVFANYKSLMEQYEEDLHDPQLKDAV
ncbi:protein [Babesia ovata]|uniref:Protein n=1 Tax=Babesia ovata TaxID=189622 RepID=A0A2H6K6Y8_9APIC|nr:protein [Babesia ovata]GBE58751.1 protein [Babesia ovata]